MFEFTKRSRRVLEVLAQSEARRLNSDSLGPEHILLALINEEDSVAGRILKNLGINFIKLKSELENSIRQTKTSIILGKVPINSRYKSIVETSKDEARKLKNSYIGTEHLLLAIFKEGSTSGLSTLHKSGIDYNIIRNEILRALGKASPDQGIKDKGANKPPALDEFAHDLTKMAVENSLDPVIGRNDEINRLIRILSRKRKNNPILIGEAGVGKTAIVEGLAQRIVKKKVPESIQNSRVLSLDLASVVAGTKYRGEFEDRLKRVVKEIRQGKNIIIFIDEIHSIIGAGAAEGAIDAANILKPALARGELQCIGATTLKEFKMYVEKDAALVRRFQSIIVDEPDVDETIEILKGLRKRYEDHHKVEFSDESLVRAVLLSERYINDRYLPDKAIDILDETGAMARLDNFSRPEDIIVLENKIDELNKKKNDLVLSQEYEQAAAVRDSIIEMRKQLRVKMNSWGERKDEYKVLVNQEHIAAVVSESTGIPIETLDESESERLLRIEEELHKRIIGQEEAISVISKAIRRSRIGLGNDDRPSGSFIFLGPTGVGKTELAKALAEFLFDDEKNILRFDMAEYMEKHSVSRLIGSPPGYIGYEEGGQLTEKVKRKPFSVILLDEIEKAHPDVFNVFLQVLDEGELTDGSGTTVSFRDTVIIMTSNIGNRYYQNNRKMGFAGTEGAIGADENEKVSDELKKIFNPEFLNRIDEIVYFHKLEKKHIKEIVKIMLNEIIDKLSDKGIELSVSSSVKKYLTENGYDEKYGARNLRRLIQREIEDNLAVEMIKGKYGDRIKMQAIMKKKAISFRILESHKEDVVDDGESELSQREKLAPQTPRRGA
ncbi:ATP-dependent Clp protease ATP-binding subunit [Spirochaetota bacterium]